MNRDRHSQVQLAFYVPATEMFAGIEHVTHDLATSLATNYRSILDVHVIYGAHYDYDFLKITAYSKHCIESSKLRDVPHKLGRFLRSQAYDIFVCPQIEASTFAWLASRGCDIPIFITHLHGNVIKEAVSSIRSRLIFAFYRLIVSRSIAAVLAVSPTLAKHVVPMGLSRTPVMFARNPVRVFQDVTHSSPGDGLYRFVNVAGLHSRKGQEVLLDAFAVVANVCANARLMLVGQGPDEAKLKEQAIKLGLENAVEFCGYAPDPSIYYRTADCFVMSSRAEGFGLVLIEALSCGLPIVSTDCQFGPADILTDARLGSLVPVDNAGELAAAMLARLQAPDTNDERTYRRAVSSAYFPDAAARLFLDILRSAVERNISPALVSRYSAVLAYRES